MALAKFRPRFLIVSIGNPWPQFQSLHSAGHFAITSLSERLHQAEWATAKIRAPVDGGKSGTASYKGCFGPKYTLVRSPTYMNVSGGFVSRLWQDFVKRTEDPANAALVVLHDELELDLGLVKVLPWDRGTKGHNGIRSCKSLIKSAQYEDSRMVRMAVGIGRPESRASEDVSRHVLGPMTQEQKEAVGMEASEEVERQLDLMEAQWKAALEG